MKKLLTLILTLAALSASAADFQLLFGADPANLKPVTNGETYTTGYTMQQMSPVLNRYLQESWLYIKGTKGLAVTVEVAADCDDKLAVCSINGTCTTGANQTKQGTLGQQEPIEGTSDVYDMLIDYVTAAPASKPVAELLKDITVKVKVYPTDAPDQAVECTVIMSAAPESDIIAGIGDIVVDQEDAEAVYYDLRGVKVDAPAAGSVVIRRKGIKTEKIVF